MIGPRNILRFIRRIWMAQRRCKTHPRVVRSQISDINGVDPTAFIYNSLLSGAVSIGPECRISKASISGDVRIGRFSAIEDSTRIISGVNPIVIGNFCSIGPAVHMYECNHIINRVSTYYFHSIVFGESYRSDVTSKGPITIGHDVLIGAQCVILSGARVGNGTIVGANSTVIGELPDYSICAGSPARVIRKRFDESVVARLRKLQWWHWSIAELLENQAFFSDSVTNDSLSFHAPLIPHD